MQRPSGVCVFVCVCGPLGMRMGPQVCAGAYWCVCVCGPSGMFRGPSGVCVAPQVCTGGPPMCVCGPSGVQQLVPINSSECPSSVLRE